MHLAELASLLPLRPDFNRLVRRLDRGSQPLEAVVLDEARPYLAVALQRARAVPTLMLTSSPDKARWLHEQISAWSPPDATVLLFPEAELLSYEHQLPDPTIVYQRLEVLSALADWQPRPQAGQAGHMPPLVVASAAALARKSISRESFRLSCITLTKGARMSPMELLDRLLAMGYEVETTVEVPGSASRRGGIVDIFSPNYETPLRLEFLGSQVESIRHFEPGSQRSLSTVASALVVPASETVTQAEATILDYLPPDAMALIHDPAEMEAAIAELLTQLRELLREQDGAAAEPAYLAWPELRARLEQMRPCLVLNTWETGEYPTAAAPSFQPAPRFAGSLADFEQRTRELLRQGYRVIVASHQSSRIRELLHERGVASYALADLDRLPPPGSLTLTSGAVAGGWLLDRTALLTDIEVFGFVKQRRSLKRRPVRRRSLFPELSAGDYVVHVEHGIARFAGIVKRSIGGIEQDYLLLEYAANDKLYVATDQADRVSRYIGAGEEVTLTRLGGHEWARVKQRVKESAREIAEELIALYAAREIIPGIAFSQDNPWQAELEASFPYVETPDQLEAVRQIKEDMEKARPMDRLVCGDVGYGKTEVAIRAAFKAILDGKQVAVLVPTTVLAQQHYITFTQRLAAFPARVDVLSRFRSEKEQQDVVRAVSEGKVDIVIGTHRLLQKDVKFADLGLVIIDEEQRFGVSHKERLKQMRKEIDVLTLSATPIPRTLHMSLAGVRDLSVMETPPEERLPIKTFVGTYNEKLIREAILRELERQGQVFFVHNRVHSIGRMRLELAALVPEARIAIAHGQMPEEDLERVMLEFTQHKADVLLCTTIIESGLDMPSANTLIVNDADRLGLAQLYQLRGRVGRSSNRAYAYFFYARAKHLTPAAQKRLQTIYEATELGAGFHIAMKDLEIRGAGNLLGAEQSGYIAAVGFDLYTSLLAEAVEEAKAHMAGRELERTPALPLPSIDLPLTAFIPEEYVSDPDIRVALYQRLAKVRTRQGVAEAAAELQDRFGKPPAQAQNLLYLLRIRVLAMQAGVEVISRDNGRLMVRLKEGLTIRPERVRGIAGLTFRDNQLALEMRQLGKAWPHMLASVLERLAPTQS